MKHKVSFVIPNWNGQKLLMKHLPAVLGSAQGAQIIVADDASTDDSVVFIQKVFPQIKLVVRHKHSGFASTVNDGVKAARGEIVVLLNTDVEPEKDFLVPILTHFSDRQVFAAGCMDKSIESGKTVLRGRGLGYWEKGFFVHSRGEVDKPTTAWVSGGSGAYRKDIWMKLGGMDEQFNPFYWEDIDLSYRARKAGYKIVFEPKSVVRHFHELGSIKSVIPQSQVQQVAYRNQFIFIWKNLTDWDIWLAHIFFLPIRLLQAFLAGDWPLLVGVFRAKLSLPVIIWKNWQQRQLWKLADRVLDLRYTPLPQV